MKYFQDQNTIRWDQPAVKLVFAALIASYLGIFPCAVEADLFITATENANNTVNFAWSGDLDLSSYTPAETNQTSTQNWLTPGLGSIESVTSGAFDLYYFVNSSASFGENLQFGGGIATGAPFAITERLPSLAPLVIAVPTGFQSGAYPTGSLLLNGSFNSLGLNPTATPTLLTILGPSSDNDIWIQFNSVPEPGSATLLGLLGVGSMIFRRRRSTNRY